VLSRWQKVAARKAGTITEAINHIITNQFLLSPQNPEVEIQLVALSVANQVENLE
jgi:hypothetical protein